MENEKGPICQSCAMPLMMNGEDARGANADGSKSEDYCHFCFADGAFTDPELTLAQQMEKLTAMGVEKFSMSEEESRKWVADAIPNLKRWQSE